MRITGTHIYTMLRCSHAVALDLHEDRSSRRALTEVEEFVRRRGMDWESRFTADLGYSEPEFPRGDFAAGAEQTVRFLREGVPGVCQGVLLEENRLGIPDLLRREVGESKLGEFHYVVGDIKSSGRPRSDQVLQVAFYSDILASVQGRDPGYGYLILKDGREERFELRDFAAALAQVEGRARALGTDPSGSRPFLGPSCSRCHWSERCLPQLERADDLSLVQGMTPGLRTTLERSGVVDCGGLLSMAVESVSRRSHLEPTLLRRLVAGAKAHAAGRPLPQKRSRQLEVGSAAVLHCLSDPFADRMLFFGVQYPAEPGGESWSVCPPDRKSELSEFTSLLDRLPKRTPLLHYGETLPRWFSDAARDFSGRPKVEARFIDLARRLRGASVFPGPVFGFAQHVEHGLGTDPHREGEADAAGMWAQRPEGREWLAHKGRSDLGDLCRLVAIVRSNERSDQE